MVGLPRRKYIGSRRWLELLKPFILYFHILLIDRYHVFRNLRVWICECFMHQASFVSLNNYISQAISLPVRCGCLCLHRQQSLRQPRSSPSSDSYFRSWITRCTSTSDTVEASRCLQAGQSSLESRFRYKEGGAIKKRSIAFLQILLELSINLTASRYLIQICASVFWEHE
jgi:hypothetical protein